MKYNLISPVHLTSPAVRTEPVTVCQIWIKHSSVFWQVNYQCRVPHAPDELPDGRPRLPAQVWELWVVILCLSVAGRIVWQMVSLSNHRSVTDRVIWLAYIQRPRFEMSYTLLHLMDCKNIKQKKKRQMSVKVLCLPLWDLSADIHSVTHDLLSGFQCSSFIAPENTITIKVVVLSWPQNELCVFTDLSATVRPRCPAVYLQRTN